MVIFLTVAPFLVLGLFAFARRVDPVSGRIVRSLKSCRLWQLDHLTPISAHVEAESPLDESDSREPTCYVLPGAISDGSAQGAHSALPR